MDMQKSTSLSRCFLLAEMVDILPQAKQQQRVAFADFSAAPWQGFEKSERCPNNSSLFLPQAAVVVVAYSAEKYFLYLRLSWPAGHSKRAFTNKAQTVRCIGINSFEEKVIDKSHKKRYILFINALKKSVHCICRSESRRMLRIRYGRAVCCHFGAGAVS